MLKWLPGLFFAVCFFILSSANVWAGEVLQAGRLLMNVPQDMEYNIESADIGNVKIEFYQQWQECMQEEWTKGFPSMQNVAYQGFKQILSQDVSEAFNCPAKLFALAWEDVRWLNVFLKIKDNEIWHFSDVHDSGRPDGVYEHQEPDWDISTTNSNVYFAPILEVAGLFKAGVEDAAANSFFVPGGRLEDVVGRYESINVYLFTADYIVINISCSNIGFTEPVQLPRPPCEPPAPTLAKETIRDSVRVVNDIQIVEKIILEAYEHDGTVIGIKGEAGAFTPQYALKVTLSCREDQRDEGIALWDKVLDGLQVNY